LKVVVKLGGFVFPPNPDPKVIQSYADVFRKISERGDRLVVVAGGGADARKYIRLARELGASEFTCDLLGIEVSRLNARLIISALANRAYPEPPQSLSLLQEAFEIGKIVVAGGMQPAQSTNAVAALSAEAIAADLLLNATNIDGVYTSDPKKNPSAKLLDTIETVDLMKLVLSESMEAGTYELFDPVAIKVVERSGVKTRILDGREPENIEKAARGESLGTLVLASGRQKR
jgi:uridylate kinase